MQTIRSTRKPRIAVLMGDPAGIGPEIAVRLLSRPENRRAADLVLVTDVRMLDSGQRAANCRLDVNASAGVDAAPSGAERIDLFEVNLLGDSAPPIGQSSEAAGRAVLASLKLAADAARAGHVDGILFAPLNKHAMRLGGLVEEDEMRFLQSYLGVDSYVTELNITGTLWTSRVTSHIPLRDVAAAITVEGVCDAVRILDTNLRSAGIAAPRIAVAGLNPHAGDGGNYGDEEARIIEPAVRQMREAGVDASGPFPADTVFLAARRGDYDAVVSMYHDQGQIAMKMMGFERGVTLLGGLPVPVTTCASGTAFDIAGKGVANAEGLQEAFNIVTRMAGARIRSAQG